MLETILFKNILGNKQLYRHKAIVTSAPHKNVYQHTDNLDQYTDLKYIS